MKKPQVGGLDLVSSLIASLSVQALEVNELVHSNSIFRAKKGSIIEHRVSCRQWCRTSWERWWGQFVFVRTSYISRPLPVTTRWAWFPNHRSNSPQDRERRGKWLQVVHFLFSSPREHLSMSTRAALPSFAFAKTLVSSILETFSPKGIRQYF